MTLYRMQSGNVTDGVSAAGAHLTPLGGGRALLLWSEYTGPAVGTDEVIASDVVDGWTTYARVATLTGSGYSFAGSATAMPYIGPNTSRSAAVTSAGNVLVMTGAGYTSSPRGYRLLEIDPDTSAVTVHPQVDVTETPSVNATAATWGAQATSRLPGSDTFIQLRQMWFRTYVEAVRVSGTTVTVVATTPLIAYDSIANGYASAGLDVGTVIPLDANTALVAREVPGFDFSGGGARGDITLDRLRLWKVTLTGSTLTVTTRDVSWPYISGTSTGLYPTDGPYVAEIIGGNPSTTTVGNEGTISGPLIRRGIAYTGGTFTVTDLPLAQLNPAMVPAGVTGTTYLPPDNFIPIIVGDELVVAHSANVTEGAGGGGGTLFSVARLGATTGGGTPTGTTTGYTVITTYNRATGNITGTYWDQAQHVSPKELDGYYDSTSGQLVLTTTDVAGNVLRPTVYGDPDIEGSDAGDIRLIDYSPNPSYPISQQLRSTGSAFI